MERSSTGVQKRSRQPHLIESLKKKEVEGASPIHEHSVELNILYDGANYQAIPSRLWYKVWVVTAVKSNGDLWPSKVLEGGGFDHQDLPDCELLLPLGLIRIRATKNVVDPLMSLGDVTLGILRLLLLIGYLENLIYKTLELVTVSGLVLFLRWKMQMRSRKPSNSPVLGRYSLCRWGRSTALTERPGFLFLSWPLDELG
jgi:hypothetical protein